MENAEAARAWGCPCLRSVTADQIWLHPTGIYCQYPSGRVRVLSRDTVARFCTTGRYYDCPVYYREYSLEIDGTGLA